MKNFFFNCGITSNSVNLPCPVRGPPPPPLHSCTVFGISYVSHGPLFSVSLRLGFHAALRFAHASIGPSCSAVRLPQWQGRAHCTPILGQLRNLSQVPANNLLSSCPGIFPHGSFYYFDTTCLSSLLSLCFYMFTVVQGDLLGDSLKCFPRFFPIGIICN